MPILLLPFPPPVLLTVKPKWLGVFSVYLVGELIFSDPSLKMLVRDLAGFGKLQPFLHSQQSVPVPTGAGKSTSVPNSRL